MLSNVWWNAIDTLYPYADYLGLATFVVVFLASAGILLLFRRMVRVTGNLNRVAVSRSLGWACFALTIAGMVFPSWYCEYKRPGAGVFFGGDGVSRSFVLLPPVCGKHGQPRIQLDTTIMPVLVFAGLGVGFLCLAAQLSRPPRSSPPLPPITPHVL